MVTGIAIYVQVMRCFQLSDVSFNSTLRHPHDVTKVHQDRHQVVPWQFMLVEECNKFPIQCFTVQSDHSETNEVLHYYSLDSGEK